MGINVSKVRIPVEFEFNDDSDSRFKKVKVWIAHTGENLNNSYFTKETLGEMAKTLPKIPIVGYIEVDENGEDDFSDHRREIVIKSGVGADIRYAGHAYGFLPDECNAQFETRDGKEWLTAEGYIWTKFKDAVEIFDKTSGVKSQSMEIEQAEGVVDDIGRLVIESAVFSALCILGEEVSPAMTGSTVEFFNERKNQYQFELDEMYKEFKREKGELNLPITDEVVETVEETEQVEFTETEIETVEDTAETETPETPEEEAVEDFSEKTEETETVETEEVTEGAEAQTEKFSVNKEISINFQLSHDDQRVKVYEELNDKIEHYGYHYILAMYNDHAIVEEVTFDEDWENRQEKIIKVKFTIENDEMTLGEIEEVFPMFLTQSEKVTIDNQRAEIETLTNRLAELEEFKQHSELETKETLVAEYAEELDEEVVKTIRENFSAMTIEEVEKEVALQFFKKAQEKKKENATSVGVQNFSQTKAKEHKYGELDRFFVNKN